MPHLFYPLGAKFEAIKHATSTGIMRHCENNLEQGSRIQDKYKDYTLGIQLNASGVGAGALVYLRRIFEGLLEESHQRCVQLENWDEEVYKGAHVDEKIKMVEDRNEILIPKELQAIRKKFYGALSKGIHELPENECKEMFPAFRYVIESVLDARIAKIEHDKKRNEMMKVINSIKG